MRYFESASNLDGETPHVLSCLVAPLAAILILNRKTAKCYKWAVRHRVLNEYHFHLTSTVTKAQASFPLTAPVYLHSLLLSLKTDMLSSLFFPVHFSPGFFESLICVFRRHFTWVKITEILLTDHDWHVFPDGPTGGQTECKIITVGSV